MSKLMVFIGATAGGWLGWFAGERFGTMTAFMREHGGDGRGHLRGPAVGVELPPLRARFRVERSRPPLDPDS